jgi:magnesium and cobalt transporter
MSEGRSPNDSGEQSWIEKISRLFSTSPRTREDINEFLLFAKEHLLLDEDEFTIIQGAMDVTDIQVREVMVPRSKMIVIKASDNPEEFLPAVIKSGHSRFPLMGEDNDDVLGILHAKDLLQLILDKDTEAFDLSKYIRPVPKVPESKRLNKLLNDFRTTRNHMAIVIDEYGGISGLITIEDVLEEIVGEIEDEFDVDEDESIKKISDNDYLIKGHTTIEDFNHAFDSELDETEFDTIAGLVTQQFGHIPQRNESVIIDKFTFKVLHADKRRIHLIRLSIAE